MGTRVCLRACLVGLTFSTSASAAVIFDVDANATGPFHDGLSGCSTYADLQDALAVTTAGDHIRVADGTYTPDHGTGDRLATLSSSPAGAQKIYWTDTVRGIQRANLDGSDVEILVPKVLDNPRAITLDVISGKMYWTDTGAETVRRANLDGSEVDTLVTGVFFPRGIALDLNARKVYWSEPNRIQRANLDGSNVEPVVGWNVVFPLGIALDTAAGKMYWTDPSGDAPARIQRANLDGSDIENLVTSGLVRPTGIGPGRS